MSLCQVMIPVLYQSMGLLSWTYILYISKNNYSREVNSPVICRRPYFLKQFVSLCHHCVIIVSSYFNISLKWSGIRDHICIYSRDMCQIVSSYGTGPLPVYGTFVVNFFIDAIISRSSTRSALSGNLGNIQESFFSSRGFSNISVRSLPMY